MVANYNARHVMIDIECLGTGDMPVVLSIGIIKFDPWGDYRDMPIESLRTKYLRPSFESCQAIGCDIDEDTLDWWAKQDPVVLDEAFNEEGRISLRKAMKELYRHCLGCTHYWGHGAQFDYGILEHIAAKLERGVPWRFYQVRDSRTVFDMANPDRPSDLKHHALYDCLSQIIGVQNVYRKLNVRDV